MRCAVFALLASQAVVSCGGVQPGVRTAAPAHEQLAFTAQLLAKKALFTLDEPISLEVALCNCGSRAVRLVPLMVPQNYFLYLLVKDQRTGAELDYVGPMLRLEYPAPIDLPTLSCFEAAFDLNALFRLAADGSFVVDAYYWSEPNKPRASLVSLATQTVAFSRARGSGPRRSEWSPEQELAQIYKGNLVPKAGSERCVRWSASRQRRARVPLRLGEEGLRVPD